MSQARPVIGIPAVTTTAAWGFWRDDAHLVADTYASAVWAAGGLPLAVPPLGGNEPGTLAAVLDRVDALLLVGGADVDPARFGEDPDPLLEEISAARDAYEFPLVDAAFDRDLPVLGICRGVQVMNVATGGTLYQDLVDAGLADHRRAPGRLDDPTFHEVQVEPGSLLAGITGAPTLVTNSHHHQGVAKVGSGAVVTARASQDGCVEALEWPDLGFALGVQWHPETPRMTPFFAALVAAARAAAERR